MKRIVPLLTFLTVTATLLLTACEQVERETTEQTTPSPATQIEQQPIQEALPSSEEELEGQPTEETSPSPSAVATTIPTFRVGLNGEYDPSGLAKRVASAFASDTELTEIATIYVAQAGSTVILKGIVPNRAVLDKMMTIAQSVDGATSVEANQVQVDP